MVWFSIWLIKPTSLLCALVNFLMFPWEHVLCYTSLRCNLLASTRQL